MQNLIYLTIKNLKNQNLLYFSKVLSKYKRIFIEYCNQKII